MNRNVNSLFPCLFLLIVSFFSCQNRSSKEIIKDSVANSSSQTQVLHKTNDDSLIKTTLRTTLDFLQGVWIIGEDNNDVVTIKDNKYIESYNGEKDTLVFKIIFTDTCLDSNLTYDYVSKLDQARTSGKHFISLDTKDTSNCLCYNIDYLDNKSLKLNYRDRLLSFIKKK